MIKTMAVEINDNTYPIAVACLPAGFAMLKKTEVYGSYLVINHLLVDRTLDRDSNQWISRIEDPTIVFDDDGEEIPIRRRSRFGVSYSAYGSGPAKLTLQNFWMSKQDFEAEFKRTVGAPPKKNDTFFVVVPI